MSYNRNGNLFDKRGACRICDGEITNGHTKNCDVYKMEQRIEEILDQRIALFEECKNLRADLSVSRTFITERVSTAKDTERIDALQRSLSSVQFNTRQMKWTVQLSGQVIGKIGVGGTAREAIDDAIQRDIQRINEASEEP